VAVGASEAAEDELVGESGFPEQERRFLLTRPQAVKFLAAIGPHAMLEVYDRRRPIAYTRTTYFDTDDLAYLRSCSGPIARRLRVREYAFAATTGDTPILAGPAYLELKQNVGETRAKVRIAASPEIITRILEEGWSTLPGERELGDQLAGLRAIQKELCRHPVRPRIATWYRRVSLCGEAGRVRVTLDDDLTFFRPQPLGRSGEPVLLAGETVAYGPARVLEVKYTGSPPLWLEAATLALTPAPRFSKFRTGMMAFARRDWLDGEPIMADREAREILLADQSEG
jgi:hypothetical protein